MSNLFKYKIAPDEDSAVEDKYEQSSSHALTYLALIMVGTVMISFFSAIVTILEYCFPSSLDGTYIKLFF